MKLIKILAVQTVMCLMCACGSNDNAQSTQNTQSTSENQKNSITSVDNTDETQKEIEITLKDVADANSKYSGDFKSTMNIKAEAIVDDLNTVYSIDTQLEHTSSLEHAKIDMLFKMEDMKLEDTIDMYSDIDNKIVYDYDQSREKWFKYTGEDEQESELQDLNNQSALVEKAIENGVQLQYDSDNNEFFIDLDMGISDLGGELFNELGITPDQVFKQQARFDPETYLLKQFTLKASDEQLQSMQKQGTEFKNISIDIAVEYDEINIGIPDEAMQAAEYTE